MSVTIHTTIGDLKVEIFCDTAPRTAFNFLALAASGAYNDTTFHRNIKGFMIQAGDTAEKTGSKGGESIWGPVAFPDEFHPNNIHDRRGVLSMANKGTVWLHYGSVESVHQLFTDTFCPFLHCS